MTNLEEQITQITAVAWQHYPRDAESRNAYMVDKLKERLREFHYLVSQLPVKEMHADLPNVQTVASQGKWVDGEIRSLDMRREAVINFLSADPFLPAASSGTSGSVLGAPKVA